MVMLPSELLARCERDGYPDWVSVDTETSGLYPDDGARISTVSVAWVDWDHEWEDADLNWQVEVNSWPATPDLPVASIAWPFHQGVDGKPEAGGQATLWADADNLPREEFAALLQFLARCPRLTYHNAKFDMLQFRAGVARWPDLHTDLNHNLAWDTQNGNAYLWPLEPTSLKPTCVRVLGAGADNEQAKVKKYLRAKKLPAGRWDLMPWDIIGAYADQDARLTIRLWHHQTRLIDAMDDEQKRQAQHHLSRRLEVTKLLYRMECRGLPYDEVRSRQAQTEAQARAVEVAKRLPFKPTPDAAKRYWFGDDENSAGLQPYETTERGAPSLTAEIVEVMVAEGVEYADTWADYQSASRAASMWYGAYADAVNTEDGRLRTCFRQNGTRSSRFSVERVNLQAIPQNYRLSAHRVLDGIPTPRNLVASAVATMDGWRLVELDLAQAELRVASLYAGEKTMLRMIAEGTDLHTYTTEQLFRIQPGHEQFDRWRQVGKRGNFSLCFGSGGDTFRRMVSKETGIRLEPSQADRIVADWNRLYPAFSRAIDEHMWRVQDRQRKHGYGWVGFRNGERRVFAEYEDAHKAFNQRVQGNLAQFGIDWMLRTDAACRGAGLDRHNAGLLLTIHDSQVLLVPEGREGQELVDAAVGFASDLWGEWFPGVPGGAEAKDWK